MRCLIEMYKCIESRGLQLSWENIVESLRNMKKNYLSDKIQSKYVTPFLQPSPSQCVSGEEVSTNEASIGNSSSQEQNSPQDNFSVIGDSHDDKETNTVLNQHVDDEKTQILSTMLPERLYQEECTEPETEERTRVDQRETEEETRVDQRENEKQIVCESKSLKDDYTISLWFKQVGDVVKADFTISEPSLVLEDHDIKIHILKKYWSQGSSKVLTFCLATGLKDEGLTQEFILISPIFHLSCDSEQPVEVLLTVPHSLVTSSEDQLKKMTFFTSPGSKLSGSTFLKFNNLQTPCLTVEDHYAMFITTLRKSSYFVMGLASSTVGVSLSPLPVVPLKCSLYVEYPADLNDYIAGTNIYVCVTLNLKTVELFLKRQRTKDMKVGRMDFILSEPEATVDGVLDSSPSDWLSLREFHEVCQYTKIAQTPHYNHTTAGFVVQCLNQKEPLKLRVSVTIGGYKLAELPITLSNPLSKAELTRKLVPADVSPNRSTLTSTQEKPEILEDNEDGRKQPSSECMEKDHESKMVFWYGDLSKDHLTRKSSSFVHEHYPGMKIEITSNHWSQYPSDEVSCKLGAPSWLDCIWPSGYIFISKAAYLSCETEQSVDVKITLPHSLATSSEDYSETIEIFASTASFVKVVESGSSFYSIQQFIPVKKSDSTMDDDKITFTTSISGPSLYVVGIPSSIVGVAPTPLTVVPLQCVVSVYCPSDLDSYLSDAYIIVNISMDLSREKMGTSWKLVRESHFTLPGPVFSFNGTVETSLSPGWQSVRAKKGSFNYDEIAISEKWNKKMCYCPPQVMASFYVKCCDSNEPLKFRVTVLCHNNNELVNLLLTPLVPADGDEDTETDTD